MTRRATFTQAEIERAIRAATKLGKVAVAVPGMIVFADSGSIPLPSPEPAGEHPCDKAFGGAP